MCDIWSLWRRLRPYLLWWGKWITTSLLERPQEAVKERKEGRLWLSEAGWREERWIWGEGLGVKRERYGSEGECLRAVLRGITEGFSRLFV